MVRWLIQYKDVRLGNEQARQSGPHAPTSREFPKWFVSVGTLETKTGQHPMGIGLGRVTAQLIEMGLCVAVSLNQLGVLTRR